MSIALSRLSAGGKEYWGFGFLLEKKSELSNRVYTILYDMADWSALLTRFLYSYGSPKDMEVVFIVREVFRFMKVDLISDQEESPSVERAHWKPIIDASYKGDIVD